VRAAAFAGPCRAPLGETGGATVCGDQAGMRFYQTGGPVDKREAVKLAKLCHINRS
jgi:hypothetical protein